MFCPGCGVSHSARQRSDFPKVGTLGSATTILTTTAVAALHAGAPTVRYLPGIIQFLGYNPEPMPNAASERLAYGRRQLGFTQEAWADVLQVDPVTIYRWKKWLSVPCVDVLARIQAMLGETSQREHSPLNH